MNPIESYYISCRENDPSNQGCGILANEDLYICWADAGSQGPEPPRTAEQFHNVYILGQRPVKFRLGAKLAPSCFRMGKWKSLWLSVVTEYDRGLSNFGGHEVVVNCYRILERNRAFMCIL
jgi:hypothetical protein